MTNIRSIDFLSYLSDEQKKVCQSEGNIILTACPGSGKTRTVTYRLAYLQSRYSRSSKIHVAITYTHRAADEIQSRLDLLDVDMNKIWVGTIHQFCLSFIIRPYAMYSKRLKNGYTLIDEYTKKKYLSEIEKNLCIQIQSFENPLKNRKIYNTYKKYLLSQKEIDFDDVLEISSALLKENAFICENIASRIFSVQVDEYQDTNEKQYDILSMISKADRNIWFSFIGDRNQAIYGNLGGIAKSNVELSNMFNLDFQEYSLSDCYRSSQQIIDLYKNFAVDPVRIISKKKESEAGCIYFCDNINKTEIATFICRIVKGALEKGVPESEICIIAPVWYMLFPVISELKEQLPNVKFDSPEISPFKYDPMNPFYLVARLAFTFSEKGSRVRRKIAKEIIDILSLDFGIELPKKYDFFDLLKAVNEVEYSPKQNGLEYYKKIIERLMISMKINLSNEEKLVKCYNSFWENTMERIERYRISTSCDEMSRSFNERTGVVANTIYGVKGEEYDTVIAFGLLRGYVPHWSDIMNKNDNGKSFSMKLLYVLCSRAKQNLFLISEKGRMTKSKKPYESNRELKAVVTRPDSTCKRNGCFQSGCL